MQIAHLLAFGGYNIEISDYSTIYGYTQYIQHRMILKGLGRWTEISYGWYI